MEHLIHEKDPPADKNLLCLQKAFYLAKKVEEGLGTSEILL